MNRVSPQSAWLAVLLLLLVGACSSPPKPKPPTMVDASIEVQPNANPDPSGRGSPVLLRIYELKTVAGFNGADFFSIYDRDKDVLGADIVVREEFQLTPGEKRKLKRELQADTRFVAVMAGFRDWQRAEWRASAPIKLNDTTVLGIRVDGTKVIVDVPKAAVSPAK